MLIVLVNKQTSVYRTKPALRYRLYKNYNSRPSNPYIALHQIIALNSLLHCNKTILD